jgi:hypothetical protein
MATKEANSTSTSAPKKPSRLSSEFHRRKPFSSKKRARDDENSSASISENDDDNSDDRDGEKSRKSEHSRKSGVKAGKLSKSSFSEDDSSDGTVVADRKQYGEKERRKPSKDISKKTYESAGKSVSVIDRKAEKLKAKSTEELSSSYSRVKNVSKVKQESDSLASTMFGNEDNTAPSTSITQAPAKKSDAYGHQAQIDKSLHTSATTQKEIEVSFFVYLSNRALFHSFYAAFLSPRKNIHRSQTRYPIVTSSKTNISIHNSFLYSICSFNEEEAKEEE